MDTSTWRPQISTPVRRMPAIRTRWMRTSREPFATPMARSLRPPPSIDRSEMRTPWPRAVISDHPAPAATSSVFGPEPISRAPLPSSRCERT